MAVILSWVLKIGMLLLGLGVGFSFPWLDTKLTHYLMEKEGTRPVHRSFLFFIAILGMSIFLLTSSQSLSGFGVLIGVQLALLGELRSIWRTPVTLRQYYFWDMAKEAPYTPLRFLCLGMLVLTILNVFRVLMLLLLR